MNKLFTAPLFLVLFFFPHQVVFAYPENAIKGYANCMACHANPRGGGLLNDYGRSLSGELMSTWTKPDFEKPFGGLVPNTEYLKWGGQVRAVQTRVSNDNVKLGRAFLMQNNLEAMVGTSEVSVVATVGTKTGPKEAADKGEFLSERHYLRWMTSDDTMIRAGKFSQVYGLNDPNHTRFIKQGLGFGSLSETYQLEFSKFFESGEIVLASSFGKLNKEQQADSEKSLVAVATYYPQGKGRLSFNFLQGQDRVDERKLVGLNGVQALSSESYLLYQLDYQTKKPLENESQSTKSVVGFLSLGIFALKGLNTYALFEFFHQDLSDSQSVTHSPGLGMRWLPIPHLEFQIEHQYRVNRRTRDNPTHRTWLVGHVYY